MINQKIPILFWKEFLEKEYFEFFSKNKKKQIKGINLLWTNSFEEYEVITLFFLFLNFCLIKK